MGRGDAQGVVSLVVVVVGEAVRLEVVEELVRQEVGRPKAGELVIVALLERAECQLEETCMSADGRADGDGGVGGLQARARDGGGTLRDPLRIG